MHSSTQTTNSPAPFGNVGIRIRPFFLLVVTVAGILGAEVIIMLLLRRRPPLAPPWEALLDACLLSVVVFPLLYILIFRPMYRLIEHYRDALAEIKHLQGVIPICTECKKIRTGTRSWEQLEIYISSHSEASFSHGICADCIRKLYPEKADRILERMDRA